MNAVLVDFTIINIRYNERGRRTILFGKLFNIL